MKKLNSEQKHNINGGVSKCTKAALLGGAKGAATGALSSSLAGPFGTGGGAAIGAVAGYGGGLLKAGC